MSCCIFRKYTTESPKSRGYSEISNVENFSHHLPFPSSCIKLLAVSQIFHCFIPSRIFFSRLYYTFIDRPTLKHDGFQKDTAYGIWPQGQLCLKPVLLPSIVQMSTTQQSGKNIQKYGIEFCQAMTKWQKSGECRMSECHNCVQRLFLKNLYTFSQFCLFRVGSWGNGLRLGFQTTLTS